MASSPSENKKFSPMLETAKKSDIPSCQDGVVNLEPILRKLGPKGRYLILQYCLQVLGTFVYPLPWVSLLFQAYEPDHTCKEVDNTTQLESYLDDNVSIASLASVQYGRCSIDVILNDSGVVTSHSLGCVNGVSFSGTPDSSVVVEWSLVCEKTGLAKLGWSLPFIMQIAGTPIFAYLADSYGRKKVYVFCGLALMTSGFATSLAPNFPVYVAFTVVNMTLVKGVMNSAYAMLMELLPHHSRHVPPLLLGLTWPLGCVVITVVAYLTQTLSWRYANLAFCSFYLYVLILPCVLDESLRWLLAMGQTDRALQVLRKACQQNRKMFHDVARFFTMHHHHSILLTEQKQMEMDEFQDALSREDVLINPRGEDTVKNPHREEIITNPKQTSRERRAGEEVGIVMDNAGALVGQGHVLPTDRPDHHDTARDHIVMNNGRDVIRENVNHVTAVSEGCVSGSHTDDTVTWVEKTEPEKYGFLDVFRYRISLVNLLVVSSVWLATNFYYYFMVLPTDNLSSDRFLNFGILSFVELPSAILTFFLMPRFNRKPLAIFFGLVSAIVLLLSEALVYIDSIAGIGVLWSSLMLYAGKFFIAGTFNMFNVYYLEVFPTGMRNTAVGIADAVARIGPITTSIIISSVKDSAWIRGVVTGCVYIPITLSLLLIPETRHHKLPDSIKEMKSWSSTQGQGMQRVANSKI